MKARIISKTYYVAETEDGRIYNVDIKNPLIKNAFDYNLEIEGVIHREDKQNQFDDGSWDRSYSTSQKFIPLKEKIIIDDVQETLPKENIKIVYKSSKRIGLPKK